jgi:hypothetical protein
LTDSRDDEFEAWEARRDAQHRGRVTRAETLVTVAETQEHEHDEWLAELHARHPDSAWFRPETDPFEESVARRAYRLVFELSVEHGEWCGNCGATLAGAIWRDRVDLGQRWARGVVCEDCATRYDYRYREMRCAGCGRLVHDMRSLDAYYCSEQCRSQVRKERRRVSRSDRECEVCGEQFTPARGDARFCGATCRQRAHRVTGNCNTRATPADSRDREED